MAWERDLIKPPDKPVKPPLPLFLSLAEAIFFFPLRTSDLFVHIAKVNFAKHVLHTEMSVAVQLAPG